MVKMIKNIFLDLDGTLITMNQDEFIKLYFSLIGKKMASHGFDVQTIYKALYDGITAMGKGDGSSTCEQLFWKKFNSYFLKSEQDRLTTLFEEFYSEDFDELRAICPPIQEAIDFIKWCKDEGYNIVLATNPLFPRIATLKRIAWGKIDPKDFLTITTYEDNYFLKPDKRYFARLLKMHHFKAEETIMIGNNVEEDMSAKSLGMKVFLLPAQLINVKNEDISIYPHGNFNELKQYIKSLTQYDI